MNDQAQQIRRRNELALQEMNFAKAKLEELERSCQHKWGEIKYVPIHQNGYMVKGDPPGTMGVDRRGDFYAPATTTPRWQRTCSECGKTVATTDTKYEMAAGQIPGTVAQVKVPDFGG